MTKRKTEVIAKEFEGSKEEISIESKSNGVAYIEINYPSAISLSTVLNDVAKWSDVNFVMDPSLNRQIQIFAPRKLSKDDAFNLFVASLESIGLRAVLMRDNVAKIVPNSLGKVAV